ncbi:hypothetical protein [Selenomonas sputigena]|uniref:hypothetical protein n=1 Tax=Selenomonas sputigena TaxID=69823 RepID=UPI00222E5136|nr:hypothetical protein [Selenomonas sputigena]UZD42779.1 hypothetical protein OL240_09550 [Selenomonas sputigena]
MIKGKMEQQLSVLKELDGLLARTDIEGQTGTATVEDVDHLRKYISDMQRACNTAITLEAALKKPAKSEPVKDAAEEKPAKRKTRAKKAAEPAPVPEPDITEAATESTEPEDDDLSFLD